MEISQSKLKGFLAFMVKNNMSGVQDALKSLGYTPSNTGKGLVDQLLSIYSKEGVNRLEQIFAKVKTDKNNNNTAEFASVRETLTGESQDASKGFWDDFLAIWSGTTVSTGDSSSTTSTPALSPKTVIAVVVVIVVLVVGYAFWSTRS